MALRIAVVLLVTVACLGWVLWDIDPGASLASLEGARWWMFGPMALLYLASHVARSQRMRVLLERRVGLWSLVSIQAVTYLAISVVPLRLGELVRPHLLLEQQGVPVGTSVGAIFIERLLDFAMLLTVLVLVATVCELPEGGVVVGGLDVVVAGQRFAAVAVALGLVGAAIVALAGARVVSLLRARLPAGRATDLAAGLVMTFHQAVRALFRQPRVALEAAGWSVLTWGLSVVGMWMVFFTLDGVPTGFGAALTVFGVVVAGMTVAPTPGFFGSFEAFALAALLLFGVERDLGATFAFLLHLSHFGTTVVLGLVFLVHEGLSLRTLVADSRRIQAGALLDTSGED